MTFLAEHKRAAVEAHRAGNTDQAAQHYATVLRFEPENTEALHNMTSILAQNGHRMAAMAIAGRALMCEPTNPFYIVNFANVLIRMEQYEAAKQAILKAIELKPDEGGFYHAMGLAHWPTDLEEAEKWLVKGLTVSSDNARIGHDLALCRMAARKWNKGLVGLAAYAMKPHPSIYPAEATEWHGDALEGRKLLLYGDQGFGDVIQFVRFYEHLKDDVILSVQPQLMRLLEFNGWQVTDLHSPPPKTDFFTLISRGLRYVNIADQIEQVLHGDRGKPYISPDGALRLSAGPENRLLTIGISWAGNPAYRNDALRSMTVDHFLSLADIPGIRFVSLQHGKRNEDIATAGAIGLIEECHPMICDLMGMANAIDAVDLVISVDTAILHLAGAMGKDAIGLIPMNCCWRWGGGKSASAKEFYPTVDLVRQPAPSDWTSVMMDVRKMVGERLERVKVES